MAEPGDPDLFKDKPAPRPEADPDAECDMPDFGRGREGHRGLPGMFGAVPDFDFDQSIPDDLDR